MLTCEQWFEQYKPIQNPFTKDGCYLNTGIETYGDELDFVRTQDHNKIWTLIDCDNEEQYIFSGYHLVNRCLYFVTEVPWKEEIEVDDNEHMTREEAIKACIDFFIEFYPNITLEEVTEHFSNEDDNPTVNRSKYSAMEFIESKYELDGISDYLQDLIHDYYSQLK